jgi:hypothetical protein
MDLSDLSFLGLIRAILVVLIKRIQNQLDKLHEYNQNDDQLYQLVSGLQAKLNFALSDIDSYIRDIKC